MPLAVGLSTDRLSLTTLLFEYIAIPLSRGIYLIISKLHIIYIPQLSIGYYLQVGNYLQGLLHYHNNPYKHLQLPLYFISTRIHLTIFILTLTLLTQYLLKHQSSLVCRSPFLSSEQRLLIVRHSRSWSPP